MKMTRRSPDERLSPLAGLAGLARWTRMKGTVSGLEPVGGEFQLPLATGCPGAGAYLTGGFGFIFVLNTHGPAGRHGA